MPKEGFQAMEKGLPMSSLPHRNRKVKADICTIRDFAWTRKPIPEMVVKSEDHLAE